MGLEKLVAGDTLDFTDVVADYPASDGWTLKYRLIPQFSTPTQAPVELTATTYNVTDYRVQAAPGLTATWAPGMYSWARWVEKTGARQTLDPLTPFLELVDDPSTTAQGYDPRSHARKVLAQIETALEGWATSGSHIAEYEIAGRRMKYADRADVIAMRSRYKAEVWREDAAAKMAQGLPNPRNVMVRFGRA
jgi:hypothetical protein